MRPTLNQKRKILLMILDVECQNGEHLTYLEATGLIEGEIGLSVRPTFLANLRKNQESILESIDFADDDLKYVKKDRLKKLHELLEEFHEKMEAKGAPLTDKMLRAEAKNITEEHNLTLSPEFNFSEEWLLRFKRQRGIV